ncbi:MAG: serine/threonine protein kinase, partial [Planctomycetota bacterium]
RRVEIVILPGSMAAGAGTPATKGGEPPAPVTPAEPAPGMMKSPAPVTPPEPAPPADEAPKAD